MRNECSHEWIVESSENETASRPQSTTVASQTASQPQVLQSFIQVYYTCRLSDNSLEECC